MHYIVNNSFIHSFILTDFSNTLLFDYRIKKKTNVGEVGRSIVITTEKTHISKGFE